MAIPDAIKNNFHKFRERGLSAYSRQGNFASRGVKRSAIPS